MHEETDLNAAESAPAERTRMNSTDRRRLAEFRATSRTGLAVVAFVQDLESWAEQEQEDDYRNVVKNGTWRETVQSDMAGNAYLRRDWRGNPLQH